SRSTQYRKRRFAPPRNGASNSIRLVPISRCSTAERLCPLLPARTERRDYSGREPANLGLWETPIRGAHVVPGWRATEESTLAMKPGRSSFQGLLTGLMMVGGCGAGAVFWVGPNTASFIERQPRNVPNL